MKLTHCALEEYISNSVKRQELYRNQRRFPLATSLIIGVIALITASTCTSISANVALIGLFLMLPFLVWSTVLTVKDINESRFQRKLYSDNPYR